MDIIQFLKNFYNALEEFLELHLDPWEEGT